MAQQKNRHEISVNAITQGPVRSALLKMQPINQYKPESGAEQAFSVSPDAHEAKWCHCQPRDRDLLLTPNSTPLPPALHPRTEPNPVCHV